MTTPRLEIDLKKIRYNIKFLVDLFDSKGIRITGINKVMLGEPRVAKVMIQAGVKYIGDPRIENIKKMRKAGIDSGFMLIRTPLMSKIEDVVKYADISMNSELKIIHELSRMAKRQNKIHQIILMIELGDLREGMLPEELKTTVHEIISLPGIKLTGIGTNLGCLGGVAPEKEKMDELSNIAQSIEERFGITLDIISGGNSANYNWFCENKDVGKINNLRIGEMIFFGWETLTYKKIEGLHSDTITLVAEVIESKIKESVPYGKISTDAFGEIPNFKNLGRIRRTVLGIGRQDILVSGLTPFDDLDILGSSSDHVVLDVKSTKLRVGDEVRFHLNYGALLAAMTSPFVEKRFLSCSNCQKNIPIEPDK